MSHALLVFLLGEHILNKYVSVNSHFNVFFFVFFVFFFVVFFFVVVVFFANGS